ncbi:hypothetical protein CCACVL1_22460, partial [Corchorus capsularis]
VAARVPPNTSVGLQNSEHPRYEGSERISSQ